MDVVSHHDMKRIGVSKTAKATALMRALESERTDKTPLINDPYSKTLAGKPTHQLSWRKGGKEEFWVDFLAIRSKFIDDRIEIFLVEENAGKGNNNDQERSDNFLLETYSNDSKHISQNSRGNTKQIVNLGSGLCTRAYRLGNLSNVNYFEIDFEAILSYKQEIMCEFSIDDVLSGMCNKLEYINANLASDDWSSMLIDRGYSKNCNMTIWVLEGLVGYVEEAEFHYIMDTMSSLSKKGDVCIISIPGQGMRKKHRTKMHRFFTDDGVELLEKHGWGDGSKHLITSLARKYDRIEHVCKPPEIGYYIVTATFVGKEDST